MKVALTLEYNGAPFCGWQRQQNGLSIQEVLEQALNVYLSAEAKKLEIPYSEPPIITASGRTDAGVHAMAQIASFPWPEFLELKPKVLKGALNGLTPKDIAILAVEEKEDSFDARFSPSSKCYQYRIFNRSAPPTNPGYPAWHVHSKLDWPAMRRLAKAYVGTHDFNAFRAADGAQRTTIRTIDTAEITRRIDDLYFTVIGRGFMKQMVRIMAGTLIDVGMGNLSCEEVIELLSSGQRKAAGRTAPGKGLTLLWVRYLENSSEKE